uniref:Uncharacterized protein n=1 Tax=Sphaerodactylus townsendi TaxID=933632 RepID=A0ACB8E785_9SAUR
MGAWRRERDEMRQEIHFLQRNMELLLARAEVAERIARIHRSCRRRSIRVGAAGACAPQQQAAWAARATRPTRAATATAATALEGPFDGTMEKLAYFLVQVKAHMEKHGGDYEDEVEQFEDPFEEEKPWVRLWQIWQGFRSVSEYVLEFRQLAGMVQDWPKQVKIHFFREGLHPEVAQWAMVTAEPTSLAAWYTRAGKAEVHLRRVQLLKQRRNPPLASPHPPSEGTTPARGGKEARESLYA